MSTYTKNKKATFDYEILEEIEAGIALKGYEVKAVRQGQVQMKGSYVTFRGNDAYLMHVHISKYKYAGSVKEYDPNRRRKLLLHKKEIDYLRGKSQEKGLTIIPLSMYSKGPFIKVKLGIARGKKKHDKRESIKKRTQDRDMRRAMKGDY